MTQLTDVTDATGRRGHPAGTAVPPGLEDHVRRRLVAGDAQGHPLATRIRRIVAAETAVSPGRLDALVRELTASLGGLGPLDALLEDPDVSEVMVNGPDAVWIERGGRIERTAVRFADADAVVAMIDRVVGPLGLRIDDANPMVDARLPDGSRFNAVLPPLAVDGPTCNIRRFVLRAATFDDLVPAGFCTPAAARYLRDAVAGRRSILVSGATSTGKTTFLNVVSSAIPATERVVTIEDSAELRLTQPHVVSLEARPANAEGVGAVSVGTLVRNALRMRPDRIVVGEVRGAEALDMLTAMTTGHDGSLGTVHAGSPADALGRIETMVLVAEPALPPAAVRRTIAAAIDVVVQLARDADGRRRIDEIVEVAPGADDGAVPRCRSVFAYMDGELCDVRDAHDEGATS